MFFIDLFENGIACGIHRKLYSVIIYSLFTYVCSRFKLLSVELQVAIYTVCVSLLSLMCTPDDVYAGEENGSHHYRRTACQKCVYLPTNLHQPAYNSYCRWFKNGAVFKYFFCTGYSLCLLWASLCCLKITFMITRRNRILF